MACERCEPCERPELGRHLSGLEETLVDARLMLLCERTTFEMDARIFSVSERAELCIFCMGLPRVLEHVGSHAHCTPEENVDDGSLISALFFERLGIVVHFYFFFQLI